MNDKKKTTAAAQGVEVAEKGTEQTPIIKINDKEERPVKILSFEEVSEKVEKSAALKAKRDRLVINLRKLKSFKIEGDDDETDSRSYQELTITDSTRNSFSIKNANTIQHIINVIASKTEQAVQEVEKQLVEIF